MKENSLFIGKLPEKLLHELEKRHIKDYKLISFNGAKGRYNLEALTKDNKKICVKYNDDTVAGKFSFEKEKSVYRRLGGVSCVPSIIWNENILVTEYIQNSYTFREWLLENVDKEMFAEYLQDIISKYKIFLLKLKNVPIENTGVCDNEKQLEMFFNKLLYSGPYGTKIYKAEKLRNKILKCFIKIKYYNNIQIKDDRHLIHGDFHLNNILVDDKKAYFIDLENVSYGSVNIELAYWYVQVWMLIYDNKEMIAILQKQTETIFDGDLFNEDEFNKIVALYQLAILLNRRFHRDQRKVKLTVLLQKWSSLGNKAKWN